MRTSTFVFTLGILTLAAPLAASAQAEPRDRVAYGADVLVAAGERVQDAISYGGDTIVEGEVLGDAVSFGGEVIERGEGVVRGEATSFGGGLGASDEEWSVADSPLETVLGWISDAARGAIAHVLIFLLGLLLLGPARERLRAMQATMIRDGLKTAGAGLLAYVAAIVAIVLFTLTIVGIPIALLVGLALPVATYVGLAAAATVIGAVLPLPASVASRESKEREVLQLAAGVLVLFVASLVPVAGSIATAIAACLGCGALVRTRFSTTPPELPEGEGGYGSAVST